MADDPKPPDPPPATAREARDRAEAQGTDVNPISGVSTAETPPGQLPRPEVTEPSPIPVPNPPGANPPHDSVTTPTQYPPYERVSEAPPEGTGQYVGQPDPPAAATSLDRPADPDAEDPSHP
jgi:hypothetical protein